MKQIPDIMRWLARVFIMYALVISASVGQSLSVRIRDIDYTRLPRINFELCVTDNDQPISNFSLSNFTITENGRVQSPEIACPDLTAYNSIMLVLDNSGSMSPSIVALKSAATVLIDSLRSNDEAALLTFGPIVFRQDFTTDKNLLRNAVAAMAPGGGTPLYDAMLDGVTRLAPRNGKRVCIVLTDGEDNGSGAASDTIIARAQRGNAALYLIGFGPSQLNEQILRRIAFETGGAYYRIFGNGQLVGIFDRIREKILSVCCSGWYESASCKDSLRRIRIEARLGARTAGLDTTIITPARPDTITLRVIATDEVNPTTNAYIYLRVEPKLAKEIVSAFKVTLRWNTELLTFNPKLPITIGTLCEGQNLVSNQRSKNIVEISGSEMVFANESGNLFGLRLKPVAADSSRLVPIEILSAELTNGCPVVCRVIPDTIAVCQCKTTVAASINPVKFANGNASITLPINITRGVVPQTPLVFTVRIIFNAHALSVTNVSVKSALIPAAGITWRIEEDSILIAELLSASVVPTDSIGVLINVTFATTPELEPSRAQWFVRDATIYQRCCSRLEAPIEGLVLIDGRCSKVVRKKGGALLHQNTPNPIGASTQATIIRFELAASNHAQLMLSDRHGSRIKTLVDSDMQSGIYHYNLRTEELPAGTYYYTLTVAGASQTRAMVVVK